MSKAADYRGLARKFRREADEVDLPHLREANLRAAERWDILAEEIEHTEGLLKNPAPKWVF
jgi:hypothetical protein